VILSTIKIPLPILRLPDSMTPLPISDTSNILHLRMILSCCVRRVNDPHLSIDCRTFPSSCTKETMVWMSLFLEKKQWSGCLCFWISRQCGLVLPLIDHSVNSGSVGAILSYLRRDGILAMPTCMPPSCAGYLYCSAYSLHSSSQRILSALRRNRRRISSTFFVLWCSD
jgi:hypothetical protein